MCADMAYLLDISNKKSRTTQFSYIMIKKQDRAFFRAIKSRQTTPCRIYAR